MEGLGTCLLNLPCPESCLQDHAPPCGFRVLGVMGLYRMWGKENYQHMANKMEHDMTIGLLTGVYEGHYQYYRLRFLADVWYTE